MNFNKNPIMKIGSMPFYWRIKSAYQDIHEFIPSRMEYTFEYIEEYDLIQSLQTESLLETLSLMYRQDANIGFLLDGHSLADGYGGDFQKCIGKYLKSHNIDSVLEIGCGGCIILENLAKKGYSVVGIDPSPVALKAGNAKNIEVIQDFFPSKDFANKVDLIFHVDVFEHVCNPVDFLRQQAEYLNENGLIIINVPDCTKTIRQGDISIAQHQHVNSFDILSLANVIEAANLSVVDIEKSGFGGSLYGIATNGKIKSEFVKPAKRNGNKFFYRAAENAKKFENTISKIFDSNQTCGFYMPLRAIPYLSRMKKFDGFRLFDDIQHWHNGYIDGLDVKIENYSDLVNDPVDNLVIMSFTFGDALKKKVEKDIPEINVYTLKEIISA